MTEQALTSQHRQQLAIGRSWKKWWSVLCLIQGMAVLFATIAAGLVTESIAISCPAIALLGLILALAAIPRTSLNLLLFGLSTPLLTSVIALSISFNRWEPDQAALPVLLLLFSYTIVAIPWGIATAALLWRQASQPPSADTKFRFSMLTLFGVVTFTCLLSALLRRLVDQSEWVWFYVYGMGVLLLCASVAVWFTLSWCSRERGS